MRRYLVCRGDGPEVIIDICFDLRKGLGQWGALLRGGKLITIQKEKDLDHKTNGQRAAHGILRCLQRIVQPAQKREKLRPCSLLQPKDRKTISLHLQKGGQHTAAEGIKCIRI